MPRSRKRTTPTEEARNAIIAEGARETVTFVIRLQERCGLTAWETLSLLQRVERGLVDYEIAVERGHVKPAPSTREVREPPAP
jgi:hypothetical protein